MAVHRERARTRTAAAWPPRHSRVLPTRWLLLALALTWLTAPLPASGITITEVGANGAAGADGGAGRPGSDGGRGEDAVAVAAAPGESNTALATGGRGGDGGDGDAPQPSGNAGGGGDATATATTTGGHIARATARGGFAGNGGQIQTLGVGPSGGNALAIGSAENERAFLTAIGGIGSSAQGRFATGGSGGNAAVEGTATGTLGFFPFIRMSAEGGRGGSGLNGSDGGDGGDATLANAVTASTASGFQLSIDLVGGTGGNASPGSILPAGTGGDGGDAHVALDFEDTGGGSNLSAFIDVVGGSAGSGSAPGAVGSATADPIDVRSSNPDADIWVELTLHGGDGGSVGPSGDGNAVDLLRSTTAGALRLKQTAEGGIGSTSQRGGDATSELTRSVASSSLLLEAEAIGGSGGGVRGGSATAFADGTNTAGTTEIIATADGATGSRTDGGNADAEAHAAGTGGGAVTAFAQALAGRGGFGAGNDPGTGSARATATSTGADDVRAEAVAGLDSPVNASRTGPAEATATTTGGANAVAIADGVSSIARGESDSGSVDVMALAQGRDFPGVTRLVNGATGSTTGHLMLTQEARDEDDGVETAIQAVNEGGGSLEVTVLADGPTVQLGDVTATSTTGQDVTLQVEASSRDAFVREKLDAPGTPSELHAESNGGAVTIDTHFDLNGGFASSTGIVDIDITNVATASTTGDLTLVQRATGGNKRSFSGLVDDDGGTARSELTRSDAVATLALGGYATGGEGGGRTSADPGDGGTADVVIDATNSAGSAHAFGTAIGGLGEFTNSGPVKGGTGGAATASLRATTTGDGQAVLVGDADEAVRSAIGGAGEDRETTASDANRGDGGNAASVSTGVALGDSTVHVHDHVTGGAGGGAVTGRDNGTGGDGGDADSMAVATGAGTALVLADSLAIGGTGGRGAVQRGDGGDARADAGATGSGRVEAIARADGGSGLAGGSGIATAAADGDTGFARASASTETTRGRVRVQSENVVASAVAARAEASFTGTLPTLPSPQETEAFAFATGNPEATDIAAARSGNAALDALVTSRGDVIFEAMANFLAGSDGEERNIRTELDITLDEGERLSAVSVAAFAIQTSGLGFQELRFRVERRGTLLGGEQVFTDLASALAFFENGLVAVGKLVGDGDAIPELRLSFDLVLDPGDAFGMALAVAGVVPEARSPWLVAIVLLCAACAARSHPAARPRSRHRSREGASSSVATRSLTG